MPSLVASLKFRMPFPIPRPISGSRFAPKIMMMMIKMTTSSGKPKLPIGRAPWRFRGERLDCITVIRRAGYGAALVLVAAQGHVAASPRQFTSGVNLVEVYASVTDERGNPITGLSRADFELHEDGVLQTVSNFAAGSFPLSAALAIDRSFSVAGTRLSSAKSAAQAFLGELRRSDEAMIIAVGSQVEVVAPLSTDRSAQHDAVERLDTFGTTGLYDAIIDAIDDVQPAKGRRALIILSDGNDRYSEASAADALERARRSDVMVFPVSIGPTRPALFAELATVTGGRSFHDRDGSAL